MKSNAWIEHDDQIVREFYPTEGAECRRRLRIPRGPTAVRKRAYELRVKIGPDLLRVVRRNRAQSISARASQSDPSPEEIQAAAAAIRRSWGPDRGEGERYRPFAVCLDGARGEV